MSNVVAEINMEESTSNKKFFFYGRKEKTLDFVKKLENYVVNMEMEKHYISIKKPSSTYLGHISPKGISKKYI